MTLRRPRLNPNAMTPPSEVKKLFRRKYANPKASLLFDEPIKKMYWSTSEVAKELKISCYTTRLWSDRFHIGSQKSRGQIRRFTEQDRVRMREIYFMVKEELLTLKGVYKRLSGLI